MATKDELKKWIVEALKANGNSASIVKVCRYVWQVYENDLRRSGDLFYTWQYDIRWAATELRKSGKMKDANLCPIGIWELNL